MHQSPLIEFIVGQGNGAVVDGVQDILGPRNEQPDDGAVLLGDSIQNDLRCRASQQDRFSSGDQRAEPVHLGACMIEGRDAEEGIILLLAVVFLLHDGGVCDASVLMQDRLGEACCAGGKIDRAVIIFIDRDVRCLAGVVDRLGDKILSVCGCRSSVVQQQSVLGDVVCNLFHTAGFHPRNNGN